MQSQCPQCGKPIRLGDDQRPATIRCSYCGAEYHRADSEPLIIVTARGSETVPYVSQPARPDRSALSIEDSSTFGDYELVEEVARGGMGIVFKARQISLNRVVALKMIRGGELAGEPDVKRFQAEAEAAAQLDHPNIVPIYQVGEQNGRHFFSMGFVEGKSLQEKLNDGPRPGKDAAALVKTIAEAVQYAHEKGIVHRDLKPANILLDAENQARITDFGLAKRLQVDNSLTVTGQVMGTPSFMAPEQASEKPSEVGPRTDVYALGALLYCALTGRPPFQAANVVETLKQVVEREPPAPRQLNPSVAKDLDTICLKCLRKDPSKRYATAKALAEDLGRFLNHEAIQARPVGRIERVRKWVKRRPAIAALSAALILIAVLGFSAVVWQWRRAEDALRAAETNLYYNRISLAHHEWVAGNPRRGDDLLDECQPEFRNWEWYYLKRLCHPLLLRVQSKVPGERVEPTDVAFSPDGRYVATAYTNATVRLWDVTTGNEVRTFRHAERVASVVFSPNGQYMATASGKKPKGHRGKPNGKVTLWNASTGQQVSSRRAYTWRDRGISFSPDGKTIALSAFRGVVVLWNPFENKDVATFKGSGSPAFSPDGKHLALSGGRILDIENGKELVRLDNRGLAGFHVVFSPDGKQLAMHNAVYDAQSGKELFRFFTPGDRHPYSHSVSFSPDGKRLAILSSERDIKIFDVAKRQPLLTINVPSMGVVEALAFSPHGLRLASVCNTRIVANQEFQEATQLDLWDGQVGLGAATFGQNGRPVTTVALSPDGRYVAGVSNFTRRTPDHPPAPGETRVWDTRTGRLVLELAPGSAEQAAHAAAWSPDSQRLATACWDQTVKVWRIGEKDKPLVLEGHKDLITGLTFNADGEKLAMVGKNGSAGIWDAHTGRILLRLPSGKEPFRDLVWSPDGKQLAAAGDERVTVWNAGAGELVQTFAAEGIHFNPKIAQVMWSPDGQRLAATMGTGESTLFRKNYTFETAGSIWIWDVESGKRAVRWGENPPNGPFQWSPDGKRIAVLTGSAWTQEGHKGQKITLHSGASALALWDVDSGQAVSPETPQRAHGGLISDFTFSPDGKRLVSASSDKTIKIWDVATMRQILTLRGHRDWVMDVTFSRDGRRIATGCRDGTVRVYDATPLEERIRQLPPKD